MESTGRPSTRRRIMQRAQLRLIVVTLVAVSVAWIVFRVTDTIMRRRHAAVGAALQILPEAAQRLEDFHRIKLENGKMVWELRAREAQYFEGDQSAVVLGPRMIFYTDGEERARLSGAEGHLTFDGTDLVSVEVRGAVSVEGDGYVVQTEQATYNHGRDAIVAPGAVRIAGGNLTVRGEGMNVAVSALRLTLQRNVHVTVAKPDGHGS